MLEELTIDELHEKSKARIAITSDNLLETEKILTNVLSLNDTKIDGNELHIFDNVDINEVIKAIVNNNIRIKNISKLEDNIETYYMKLLGGAMHA